MVLCQKDPVLEKRYFFATFLTIVFDENSISWGMLSTLGQISSTIWRGKALKIDRSANQECISLNLGKSWSKTDSS